MTNNMVVSSTLLKSDQWVSRQKIEDSIRGAINFRNIPNSNIYALGQPTAEAIDDVIARIKCVHPDALRIVWITLREEPVVYIHGAPYCLRREGSSLRNMKGRFIHKSLGNTEPINHRIWWYLIL